MLRAYAPLIGSVAQQGAITPTPTLLVDIDFETGDTSQADSVTEGSGNTFSVVTTDPHEGTYHGNCAMGNSNGDCYVVKSFSEQSEVYTRFSMKMIDFNGIGSFTAVDVFEIYDDTTLLCQLSIQNWKANAQYRWRIYERSNEVYTGTYTEIDDYPAADTSSAYNVIEVRWKADTGGGDGIMTVWQDDTQLFTVTNISGTSANLADKLFAGACDGSAGSVESGTAIRIDQIQADTSRLGVA